jgi:CubicO group peptidase (beta-lactamase class C family)
MARNALFLFVMLAGFSAAANAETPTLQVLNQWLAAANSGDSAKLTEFWQKHSRDPAGERVSHDLRLVSMTGGFKLAKVIKDDGTHLEVLLKEGRGGYSELTVDLASSDPPMIRGIFGHPVNGPPPGEASAATSDQELTALVQSHVTDPAATDSFSGAILISHHGKVVVDQAWGMADTEKGIKNTVDTQFCLGSMNKMFTAVAILQLVEQGKLSLDGHIADYWGDYPNHDLATRVTIRQLLSHTGGTGDIFTPEYEAHRLETRTLADYVKLFGGRPVAFEPGSRMEYSNYGFILLGRLIEIVSRDSYEDYVRQHVFAPAGMSHTDSRPESDHIPGRAVGYTKGPDGLHPNTTGLPWRGTSAGGGYSTVGDLLLFANALENGKLLGPALLKQATIDQTHTGYGFGFYVLPDGAYGHGGGSAGMNAELRILPERAYVIVVLANRDPHMATDTERYIEGLLPSS